MQSMTGHLHDHANEAVFLQSTPSITQRGMVPYGLKDEYPPHSHNIKAQPLCADLDYTQKRFRTLASRNEPAAPNGTPLQCEHVQETAR